MIPKDSFVSEPAEVRRLTGQNEAILQALREGRKTSRQLAQISLKYTSRISDLRAAGYDIRCSQREPISGLTFYTLIAEPDQVEQPRQGHDVNALVPQGGRLW